MCSILGYNNFQNTELVKIFFDTQRHRGPEFENYHICDSWILGHQRLSIIDTSSSANQPMYKDGHTIILNGEIYNYIELQNTYLKNVTLNTSSDTEVLLELLKIYGIKILNKLNGMFAFGWYNHNEKCLYLCRDRFGVKPLHWMKHNGYYYFSSEIKPLIAIKKNISFNAKIIDAFFYDTATDFDNQTFIDGINQIKQGHFAKIDAEMQMTEEKWYLGNDFNIESDIFKNYKQTVDIFEDLLTDAIKIRHRADVPICITLSGGLDSTTIYTLTKEHLNSNIQPFTFTHPGSKTDESELAKKLTDSYHDSLIKVTNEIDENIEGLREILHYLEFPIWNNSASAYFEMYKAIKFNGFTVVLEGHGSDEQLGGYPYMIEAAIEQELYYCNFLKAYQLHKIANNTHNPALNQKGKEYKSFCDFIKINAFPKLKHHLGNKIYNRKEIIPKNYFQNVIEDSFDYKIIPIVLRAFDRLSMAHAVESRCPFMDYRIVEFLRKLPMIYKVNKIGSKAILREILKKYNKDFIYKKTQKMGFASDIPKFYNNIENKKYLAGLINRFNDNKYEYYKSNASRNILKAHIDWTDIGDIWKIASLQFTKEMYGIK